MKYRTVIKWESPAMNLHKAEVVENSVFHCSCFGFWKLCCLALAGVEPFRVTHSDFGSLLCARPEVKELLCTQAGGAGLCCSCCSPMATAAQQPGTSFRELLTPGLDRKLAGGSLQGDEGKID